MSQFISEKNEFQIKQTFVSLRNVECIFRNLLKRRLDVETHEKLNNEKQFLKKLFILMRNHQTINIFIYEMLLFITFMID